MAKTVNKTWANTGFHIVPYRPINANESTRELLHGCLQHGRKNAKERIQPGWTNVSGQGRFIIMTMAGGDAVKERVTDGGKSRMRKVISIYYSSHSGSTLLAFLLNDHERIFSLGHMTGWNYPKNEDFFCSCQKRMQECPFYGQLEKTFKQAGLPFDLRNFGTDYGITNTRRLNRFLVGTLPLVGGTFIERLRDRVLYPMPKISAALQRFDNANRTLIDAALNYGGASVVTDKTTRQWRIAHLNRISGLDLYLIHLIQDIRGVVYTDMVLRNWDPVMSVRNWIQKNVLAFRYLRHVEKKITIHYEDLTDATDLTLARIHRFVGLQPQPFGGDFKNSEHHILGNSMRLESGKIKKDVRWRSELSDRDRGLVEKTALAFVRRNPDHPVSALITHYLGQP